MIDFLATILFLRSDSDTIFVLLPSIASALRTLSTISFSSAGVADAFMIRTREILIQSKMLLYHHNIQCSSDNCRYAA